MDITIEIKRILTGTSEQDLTDDEQNSVNKQIIALGEWDNVRAGLLSILYEKDTDLWNEAVAYIYFFQGMGYMYEPVETIALLYNCLSLSETLDSNLVWTITRSIKSLSYEADYDPYNDPKIYQMMLSIDSNRLKL